MTDETNPQPEQPIEAEVVPEKEESGASRNKLNNLPKEIAEELATRLENGEEIKTLRQRMIEKYPNVKELQASYVTWRKKVAQLKSKNSNALQENLNKDLAAALPSTEALQNVASAMVNPTISPEKKQEALMALFNEAMERYAVLKEKQKMYLNPDYEALMISTAKFASDIIEKLTKFREILNKDIEEDMLKRQDDLVRKMFQFSYRAYTMTHPQDSPDSKFDLFKATLDEFIINYLQNYGLPEQNVSKN